MTEADNLTKIDPLKRVWVPIEQRTANGTLVFRTTDKQVYARLGDGSIRRAQVKVRGKSARRADKHARHTARAAAQTRADARGATP